MKEKDKREIKEGEKRAPRHRGEGEGCRKTRARAGFKNLNGACAGQAEAFLQEYRQGAPVGRSNLRAGFSQLIDDSVEKRISLDEEFAINSPSTYIFIVSGDSMTELGIYEGDSIIIKKTTDVEDGDIVMAAVDGSYTLKIYRQRGGEIFLEAANPAYGIIKPKESLEIFGIATGLTRKLK